MDVLKAAGHGLQDVPPRRRRGKETLPLARRSRVARIHFHRLRRSLARSCPCAALCSLHRRGGVAALPVDAQTGAKPAEPFKVGTFEIRKTPTVGLVLRDSLIVDIAAANAAVPGTKLAAPRDMIDLIERYESGLRAASSRSSTTSPRTTG